jgi:hypothetical protein
MVWYKCLSVQDICVGLVGGFVLFGCVDGGFFL